MFARLSHAALDTIVVGKDDQDLVTSGAIQASGNAVNIADGQFGLLSTNYSNTPDVNDFFGASTAANIESFKFIAGTPNSTNLSAVSRFGIGSPAYVETNEIFLDKIESVSTVLPKAPAYHADLVSGFTPVAGQTYGVTVQLESQKRDVDHTKHKRDIYTNAAISIPLTGVTDVLDYFIQNAVTQINRRDSVYVSGLENFLVFGINTSGGSGQVLNTVAPGTTITFATIDGVAYTYTADIAFTESLRKAIAAGNIAGTATIENVNVSTAGAAANTDAFLTVGFNENRSVYDEFTHEKIRATLFITDTNSSGLDTLDYTRTYAAEGVENDASARTWRIRWNKNAAFRLGSKMPVGHTYDVTTSSNYNPISTDDSQLYTATIIKYYSETYKPVANARTPSYLTILLPASITNPTANAATSLTIATTDSGTVTSLNAVLGALLSSASDVRGKINYLGDATKAAPFV